MKYEIGAEAIVIEAGSHDFKIGERIILDEIYNNEIMKFTNLDKSDYWFMDHSEVEFIGSEFNLADYLPFPKEGKTIQFNLSGKVSNPYHSSLDIVELTELTEFPEDMWSVVSTDFNYLAIDEDGDSWFFESKPWIDGYGFWTIVDGKCEQNFVIPVSTTNWKMSLIKRPDNQK